MKSIKLITAAAFCGLILGFSSCSDSIHLERSVMIDAPADYVWEHVNSLEDMNKWSPWMDKDPDMTSSYEGEDGTVGAMYSWSSEKEDVGVGSQTITEIADGKIVSHLVFEGMGEADATVMVTEKDGMTEASWHFDQKTDFPVNIIMMFIDMEEQLGPDYQKGMDNLKAMVESNKAERSEFGGHNIEKTDMGSRTYVGVKDTITMSEMGAFFAENFGKVMGACAKAGAEVQGAPSGLYFTWDEETQTTVVMAAVAVAEGSEVDGLESFSVSGNAVMIDYHGPYEESKSAHMAMEEYMTWHGVEMNGPAIEEYANDPTTVSDPSEINTKIYYPVK